MDAVDYFLELVGNMWDVDLEEADDADYELKIVENGKPVVEFWYNFKGDRIPREVIFTYEKDHWTLTKKKEKE